LKNGIFQNAFNSRTFALIIVCALLIASFAGLSYIGVLESWGFYALFLLCPLIFIQMMETLHPTPQKVKARNSRRKGRADR
jgi:hypothetical protein